MPLVRVKPVKIPDFCVNSVKIHTGQKFTQICLWGLTNIRYVKDNPGNSSSSPSPSLVEWFPKAFLLRSCEKNWRQMFLTVICNFPDALAFLNLLCGMTSRNSLSQQVRKPCISVIPVSQMIPLNPARLAHLWVDLWVIGNIITVKIHLFWRALFICDHRGFTFHPSSNHHYPHHIIITSSSHHHHIITPSQ